MAVTDLTNTTWTFNNMVNSYVYDTDTLVSINYSVLGLRAEEGLYAPSKAGDVIYMSAILQKTTGTYPVYIYLKTTDQFYTILSLTEGEGWYLLDMENGDVVLTKLNTPPTITITGGNDVTNSDVISWLEANATQVIPSYLITPFLTNITSSNTNYEIEDGGTWTTTLTADAGYVLPESITVVGAVPSYNSSIGSLTLSNPTGNVTLTASAMIIPPEDKRLVTYEDLLEFKKQLMTVLYQYRCGYYDPNIEYSVGEFAWYEQRIYLCKVATTAGILPTNTSYWIPLVVNE